ncbi:alpha/beta fold hydrolase [Demequina salsinemoris]|uniref:alpha/beta fold hydrolase n=1 Tax=Demequina salsinemoris TaxID=577470 RepID=UPI00078591DE|nr:alpha/beta hydrolase [Demequina salsinemoris]
MARTMTRRDDARYRAAEDAVWDSRGLAREERWVDVDALGLRVRVQVHGEGRPVVFVHGSPSAGDVFVPLVAELPGVKAIIIDRPGCGLSDPLDYSAMTPVDLVEAIRSYMDVVVDEFAEGRADVVGSSAGGMVALTYAAQRPEAIRSVVLEGMPAVRQMRLPFEMRMATLAPVAAAVVRRGVRERDVRTSFRQMGHGATLRAGTMRQEDIDWRVAVGDASDTFLHDLRLLNRAASWRGPRPEWAAGPQTLSSVAAPTLWVVGGSDPFVPTGGVAALADAMPRASVHERVGEGHLPWIDDPSGHAELIARWWGSLEQ